MASCNAYSTMKGVMMPSVSAGSSQREARVMWTPHVMVPSGAATAGPAGLAIRATAAIRTTTGAITCRICPPSLPFGVDRGALRVPRARRAPGGLGGARSPPASKPPVLVPGGLGADALAGHRHVDQIWLVVASDPLHPAPQRRFEVLHRGDRLALHPLGAGQGDVVGGRGPQEQPRVPAVADHLAVGDLASPVGP